jgi:hypothetical protein
MKNVWRTLAVLAVLVGASLMLPGPKAQSAQEVAPYEFAHIPVEFHAVDVKVYKVVHQGCEIFVATNGAMGHEAASIAIATGRGCK